MIVLYWIALILLGLFGFVNFFYLWFRDGNYPHGYWRQTAVNIDKFGNREFRALWNDTLITPDSEYKFGKDTETLSEVLGYNYANHTLQGYGEVTIFLLSPNHCLKAAELPQIKERWYMMVLRVLSWFIFPVLYFIATPQKLRIAFSGIFMGAFGKWSNINDSSVIFWVAISFVFLFVIDLLWWIIKTLLLRDLNQWKHE